MRTILFSIAIGLLAANVAVTANCGAPQCCDEPAACGPQDCCAKCGSQRACKVICQTKKIEKTVWAVECDEVCLPLPRCDGCRLGCKDPCNACCEASCGKGGKCGGCKLCGGDPCAALKCRKIVPPKCGKPRCRKRLVKKTVVCEVPIYKCIPVCPRGCGNGCLKGDAIPEEATSAKASAQTGVAPLPPVMETSYLKSLRLK